MRVCADAGDWEGVAALESERRVQIDACFSRPVPESERHRVMADLHALLAINEQLAQLARDARAARADDLAALKRGLRAVRAYGANDR